MSVEENMLQYADRIQDRIRGLLTRLQQNPCEDDIEDIPTWLNPDKFVHLDSYEQVQLARSLGTLLPFANDPTVLHNATELWCDAIDSQAVSPNAGYHTLYRIGSHPCVSEETCLRILSRNLPLLHRAVKQNLNVSKRVRVLATV